MVPNRETRKMTIDQTKIGQVVTEQMEAIEGHYGDDCEIGDICTIVEVVGPHGSHVRVRTSDARTHIVAGLLRVAEAMLFAGMGPAESGDEDAEEGE
jgi:hypothetical protein